VIELATATRRKIELRTTGSAELAEGGPQLIVHLEATGREDLDDGLRETLDLFQRLSFGADLFQAGVAMTLEVARCAKRRKRRRSSDRAPTCRRP
jgi:hypothetical protein